jgi:hypothetical protein
LKIAFLNSYLKQELYVGGPFEQLNGNESIEKCCFGFIGKLWSDDVWIDLNLPHKIPKSIKACFLLLLEKTQYLRWLFQICYSHFEVIHKSHFDGKCCACLFFVPRNWFEKAWFSPYTASFHGGHRKSLRMKVLRTWPREG